MILETADQRTEDWYAARCGKATASRFKDVLAKLKNGNAAVDRQRYLTELVVERLTGQPVPTYENAAMRWARSRKPLPAPHTSSARAWRWRKRASSPMTS